MWKGIYFRSVGILRPGVYSDINAEAMIPNRPGPANTIGVIGDAQGGEPMTVLTVNGPTEARGILRGGNLMSAIELMYDPSTDPLVGGASTVKMLRLNPGALQALLTVDAKLDFTSIDYGAHTNNIAVLVATGSVSGKKVLVEHATDKVVETYDNLGEVFSVQYIGTGTAALASIGQIPDPASPPSGSPAGTGGHLPADTYTGKVTFTDELGNETLPSTASGSVGPTSGDTSEITWTVPALPLGAKAVRVYSKGAAGSYAYAGQTVTTTFVQTAVPVNGAPAVPAINATSKGFRTTLTGGVAGDKLSVLFSDPAYQTAGDLVTYLAGLGTYTATLLGSPDLSASLATSELDNLSSQNISTAYAVIASLGTILNAINGVSAYVTVARTNPAITATAPTNQAYVYLSGGTDGANAGYADWQTALDLFETEDINLLHVCSDDPAVHAMASAHCDDMSDVMRKKERICFVGGEALLSVTDAVAAAAALNDRRANYVYPGVSRINLLTGAVDALAPQWAAALVCGVAAGLPPEEPLTFKEIKVVGLEKIFTLTDINALLAGGVLPLEWVRGSGVFRIVQGITTYLKDANVIWRKTSGVRIADYLASEVRDSVEPFVGRPADKHIVTSIVNAAVTRLRQISRTDTNPSGVLIEGVDALGKKEPAFKNVVAVFDGFDLVALTFEAHPVGEVAYITARVNLVPTTITVVAL
jgi:hypothetical protein